jgi:hypothetical protein
VVDNLAKAVEVTCNAILRRVGPRLPLEVRKVKTARETTDVSVGGHLTIGQMATVLRGRSALHKHLRQRLENGDWLVDAFPNVLAEVASLRNPGVHRAHVGREAVVGLRNALVGVGCQGAMIELAKVQLR